LWRRVVDGRSSTENIAEHVAKPLAHRTINEEVEWIRDGDAAINENGSCVACRVAKHIDAERVFNDDEQQQHGQRHFNDKKDADNSN